ncbi:MAG: HNH endonuclease [Pirellulales bacterium]|nr:HNH endonuclease [Pirellulales bacterium]
MDDTLRQLVRVRASDRCEYCRVPQFAFLPRFHVEHIRAQSHQGSDDPSNLCLACPRCNRLKGPNPSSYDPTTDELVRLYNPRLDAWDNHFAMRGELIDGTTPIGRATVALLQMNDEQRLTVRRTLQSNDEYE